jgi:hypothetical protein
MRIGRDRLAARVARDDAPAPGAAAKEEREAETGFLELDAGRVCAPARTIVRIEGRDGERIEIELADGAALALDVVSLARALWSRPR